jgi:release factor glutamine methyltransferase
MNLTEAIDWAVDRLNAGGIEEARFEAELLLTAALGIKKSELVLYQSKLVEDKSFKCYQDLVKRRLKHEPSAYIVGYQPFLGLDILVDRHVLIPRPETELLAEKAIALLKSDRPLTVADIGTGSGCLAVALAKQLPNVKVIGIDQSGDALKLAAKNARAAKVSDRCTFLRGDLLKPLEEKVDLIIANPPYIPSKDLAGLQPEVKDWEPRQALDGGKDGLDYIRKIITESPKHLNPGGWLVMEFGFGQAAEIEKLAGASFELSEFVRDYAQIPRILIGHQGKGSQ